MKSPSSHQHETRNFPEAASEKAGMVAVVEKRVSWLCVLPTGVASVQTDQDLSGDSKVTGQDNKFDAIYKQQIWSGKDGSVPLSGPGSLVQSSLPVIDFINQGVENQQIKSVLDLGCGDLTYISTIDHITNGTVRYTGVDVSEYILKENEKRYPWFKGACMDITEPQAFDADLIVIKDILFHLANDQITALFDNLANSRFTFCIVTTMNNSSNGRRKLDPKHSYANVNIRLAPFFRNRFLQSLPRPRSANEGMKDQGEFLVYDKDTFNSPQRDVPTSHSALKALWDRLRRRDGR